MINDCCQTRRSGRAPTMADVRIRLERAGWRAPRHRWPFAVRWSGLGSIVRFNRRSPIRARPRNATSLCTVHTYRPVLYVSAGPGRPSSVRPSGAHRQQAARRPVPQRRGSGRQRQSQRADKAARGENSLCRKPGGCHARTRCAAAPFAGLPAAWCHSGGVKIHVKT